MKPSQFKRDPRYKQGIYKPINEAKFIGDVAIYRSSLELKFMKFCDTNPKVLKWGSENVVVPYLHPDGKMHRYFVDNFVIIQEGPNVKKYLVEIKPSRQTQPPATKNRKNKSSLIYEQVQYSVNQQKWSYAREYCKKRGFEFLILTEKDLP